PAPAQRFARGCLPATPERQANRSDRLPSARSDESAESRAPPARFAPGGQFLPSWSRGYAERWTVCARTPGTLWPPTSPITAWAALCRCNRARHTHMPEGFAPRLPQDSRPPQNQAPCRLETPPRGTPLPEPAWGLPIPPAISGCRY